jgi:hypothetical protein
MITPHTTKLLDRSNTAEWIGAKHGNHSLSVNLRQCDNSITHNVKSQAVHKDLGQLSVGREAERFVIQRSAAAARLLLGKSAKLRGRDMNRSLIVTISLICAAPLHAQDQQPNAAKLKADAQKVVSIIKDDKAKTQVYCEINDLGEQIGEADQKMDDNKAEALSRQVTELEKKLGPEYSALVNDLNNVDPNSPQGREIDSILAPLDDSCD